MFFVFFQKVRARLAKCVKFMVIGPGRTLIKEGDTPMMVYFLLTGEVEASQRAYNHVSNDTIFLSFVYEADMDDAKLNKQDILIQIQNTWVSKIKAIHGPGDCLGDVEMIEGCLRRHTYISTSKFA